jgi:hypothetical protein
MQHQVIGVSPKLFWTSVFLDGLNMKPQILNSDLKIDHLKLNLMTQAFEGKDQQHPLYGSDRPVVDTLLNGEPTDYNLAELARLRMRYQGFPGGRDIQADLDKVLHQWGLTEAALFAKTRQIHATSQVYRGSDKKDDWS